MTSSMIELVAEKMREAYSEHIGEPCCSWSKAKAEPRKAWLVCARAAIEAMREPTMEMLQEAGDRVVVGCCNLQLADAEEVWQAMIDQALKG